MNVVSEDDPIIDEAVLASIQRKKVPPGDLPVSASALVTDDDCDCDCKDCD